MTVKLTIIGVGRSLGVELPREWLDKLGVDKGDVLHAAELPDGLKLTPNDPELEEQLRVIDSVMREDRDVLKRLARN